VSSLREELVLPLNDWYVVFIFLYQKRLRETHLLDLLTQHLLKNSSAKGRERIAGLFSFYCAWYVREDSLQSHSQPHSQSVTHSSASIQVLVLEKGNKPNITTIEVYVCNNTFISNRKHPNSESQLNSKHVIRSQKYSRLAFSFI